MSDQDNKKMRIKIIKDGPYLISGKIPLIKTKIVPNGHINEYHHQQELPLQETYALCRCGQSKTMPYCDHSHEKTGFSGKETASRAPYVERSEHIAGPDLDLKDDHRCGFARFCHRHEGTAWELVMRSADPEAKKQAIIAAIECPTGRLAAYEKDGTPIEPELEPSIEILEDAAYNVNGPLFVKGNIPIESADGTLYEIRNRVALCCCGKSNIKPFCDASHMSASFPEEFEE